MRVLVLTRDVVPTAHVRLLAQIGGGLADRGASIGYLAMPDEAIQQTLKFGDAATPFSFRNTSPFGMFLTARRAVREFRPDVVLTDGERDLLLAALASGRRAGVVRRIRPGDDEQWGWRSRVAAKVSRVSLLLAPNADANAFHAKLQVVRAPVALPQTARNKLHVAQHPPTAPLTLACVPDRSGASTALCLRSFARLQKRRPQLKLILLGDPRHMQAIRVHAAALGLTDHIQTLPEQALFESPKLEFAAVWIAATGDVGALAAVAAMARGIPVIVDRFSDVAPLVAHRITGLHAEDNDLATCIASIAQLLADPQSFHSTCDAALARVQRLHSWNGFLDRVVEAIELTRIDKPAVRQQNTRGAVA